MFETFTYPEIDISNTGISIAGIHGHRALMLPGEMVGAILEIETIREEATRKYDEIHISIDWTAVYSQAGWWDFEKMNDPLAPDEFAYEAWVDYLHAIYLTKGGDRSYEVGEDEAFAAIEILENRIIPDISMFPMLREIEDLPLLAEGFDRTRRAALSTRLLATIPERVCLAAEVNMRQSMEHMGVDNIQCWMYLEQDDSGVLNSEMSDMSLWGMTAVFCTNTGNSQEELVAVVTGHLIVPFKGQCMVHPENFSYVMDAHSNDLNDVWKVIIGKFLPDQGWSSLEKFYESQDTIMPGFASVKIEVAEKYRGNRLSAYLLGGMYMMLDAPEMCDIRYLDSDTIPTDYDVEIGGVGLFILPVSGTMPAQREFRADLALSHDVLEKPKVLDMKCERRKLKLTRYFNDEVAEHIHTYYGAYLVVYDPNEYPIT